ncbi:hypothetical protein MKX01_034926 [Papaver californicum]|nr:hypothetical protein MKX01_034926 [Papaver californicum]
MAKSSIIFTPIFFGLFLLLLVAFISEEGGGVRGQPIACSPGSGSPFGSRVQQGCDGGCNTYCTSLVHSGVKSGQCSLLITRAPVPQYLCLCCAT